MIIQDFVIGRDYLLDYLVANFANFAGKGFCGFWIRDVDDIRVWYFDRIWRPETVGGLFIEQVPL